MSYIFGRRAVAATDREGSSQGRSATLAGVPARASRGGHPTASVGVLPFALFVVTAIGVALDAVIP